MLNSLNGCFCLNRAVLCERKCRCCGKRLTTQHSLSSHHIICTLEWLYHYFSFAGLKWIRRKNYIWFLTIQASIIKKLDHVCIFSGSSVGSCLFSRQSSYHVLRWTPGSLANADHFIIPINVGVAPIILMVWTMINVPSSMVPSIHPHVKLDTYFLLGHFMTLA